MIRDSILRYSILTGALLALGVSSAFAQTGAFTSAAAAPDPKSGARSAATGLAEQEFRRGVQSYYRGAFNDAVVEFEKALDYLPTENVIMEWFGKAYYRSGIEGAALQQWEYASENGYGGLLLKNKIEVVRDRRITDNRYDSPVRYTESGSFVGKKSDKDAELIFSQPVSVLPNPDGTHWIIAYGTNELLKMDVNGFVLYRTGGPLNGFDRPMDIIRLSNGNMLVSEFAGDRLSELSSDGRFIKSFGHKGRDVGGMIGPQYLAQDENDNIYVTDFGNARVDVFDKDGKELFFFGGKTASFSGLKGPTGIAVVNHVVYVVDAVTGAIYTFDTAGNYTGLLCREKSFKQPESMKTWSNFLVICDRNKVYSVDVETGALFENMNTGNAPSRVTSAVPDANGNILVTDFKSNEVFVMSKMSELVGGLFVQIERVNADAFPKVYVDVKVENRNRQSIVGLKSENFVLTENKGGVENFKLEGSAYTNDTADITLVLDRSLASAEYEEAMEHAVREIAAAMAEKNKKSEGVTQGVLRIVSAGAVPVVEYEGSPEGVSNFTCAALKSRPSEVVALDLALRLSSNALVGASTKRAVVFIGAGSVTQNAFEKYSLSDLSAFMNNNSIWLSSVLLSQGSPDAEIDYLSSNTEGEEYYVYRTKGLAEVVDHIVDIPSGVYRLSFTSRLPTDFGQRYLPVEVETYMMNRSGRDETGYFSPLH